jgi:hypothetical protein
MASQYEINRKAAKDIIEYQEWDYETFLEEDERIIYSVDIDVSCMLRGIRLLVYASDTEIQAMGISPMNVKQQARPQVAEYLTRVNFGLKIGNFEMNYADGEVRYQSILSCMKANPSLDDVDRVVTCPQDMFEQYGDGLVKVALGLTDPESAFEEARWW